MIPWYFEILAKIRKEVLEMQKRAGASFPYKFEYDLRHFLYLAALNGYGSTEARVQEYEDGSTLITYEQADWTSADFYLGGEPFSGMQTVRHKGVVCFSMQYFGMVDPKVGESGREEVYACLKQALQILDTRHPWRGPRKLIALNGLRYKNVWNGDVMRFSGSEEIIDYDDNVLYHAKYMGGVVNLT